MPRSKKETISFKFDGDLAEKGELNFYEASRFMYGASRLIYTLEHFRVTGTVLQRINKKVEADFRIATPAKGSWVLDIIALAAPIVAEEAARKIFLDMPLEKLLAWAIDKVTNGGKANRIDAVVTLEEIKLKRDKEKTKRAKEATKQEIERTNQARERTKQAREETRRMQLLQMPNRRLNEIYERAIGSDGGDLADIDVVTQAQREQEISENFEENLKGYLATLSSVPPETLDHLVSRVRSHVIELGNPLRSSATSLEIGDASPDGKIVYLTRKTMEEIEGLDEDDTLTTLMVNVVRYDKETGWGKFRALRFAGREAISFSVPVELKKKLTDDVIDAMKKEKIRIKVRFVRNKEKAIQYAKVATVDLADS